LDKLYPSAPQEGWYQGKAGGGYILFHEGDYFHSKQLAVTYKHAENTWKEPLPEFQNNRLPKTIGKLTAGKSVRISLYGDSISVGCNASGWLSVPPYMRPWSDLIVKNLRRYYKSTIYLSNASSGGADSKWGADNTDSAVNSLLGNTTYDLAIIAFGMNDFITPAEFKVNIKTIMDKIRAISPDVEFMLIATILPNPESYAMRYQAGFYTALKELEGPGVVAVNMTGVHQELLKHKKFRDRTANNINHPNDFLSRWYAQFISNMLIDPSAELLPTPSPSPLPTPSVQAPSPTIGQTAEPADHTNNLRSGTVLIIAGIVTLLSVAGFTLVLYLKKKQR